MDEQWSPTSPADDVLSTALVAAFGGVAQESDAVGEGEGDNQTIFGSDDSSVDTYVLSDDAPWQV